MLCIVALRVGVHGEKLYRRVPSRQLSIYFFRHFLWDVQNTKYSGLWIQTFSHKSHRKNEPTRPRVRRVGAADIRRTLLLCHVLIMLYTGYVCF